MQSSVPRSLFLAVAGTAVLGLSGCSRGAEDPVLADVGPNAITQGDYLKAISDVSGSGAADLRTAEGRRTFLDDLVNRELMELHSRKMFPEPMDFQQDRLDSFSRSTLGNLLMNRLVRQAASVSEADKKARYERMQRDLYLEGLLVPTLDMAQAMRQRLDEGADIRDLAAEYSILEYELAPGVIGWVSAGTHTWEMETALWSQPEGTVLGPFINGVEEGFWVVRATKSRRIPPEDSYENIQGFIANKLAEQFYLLRQKTVQDSIHHAAGVSYPEAGMALMMLKYYAEPSDELAEDPMWYLKETRVPPTYTAAEETVTVVGFTKYPSWTAVDFTRQLMRYPTGLWPRGHTRDQLLEVYKMVVREHLIHTAAIELGLDKTPEYADAMATRERRMRINYLYHNVLTADVNPTDEEIKGWFDEHRERYKAPPSVKIAYFASENVAVMEDLRADWVGGMSFNEVREKYEGVLSDLEAVGESPFIPEGHDPGLDGHILEVKTGDVAPAFLRDDKSYVFKVIQRRESRLVSFDEAKDVIKQDAVEMLKDAKLDAFLEQARAEFPVTIHEEAVASLAIPDSLLVP